MPGETIQLSVPIEQVAAIEALLEDSGGVTDKPWNGSASRFSDEQWQRSCVLDRGGDAPPKSRCSLPIREPDGTLNRNGVHAAAARVNQVSASSEAIAKAKGKLRSAYGRLKEDPPQSVAASDSRRQMPDLAKIAKALELDDEATEEQVLEALAKRPEPESRPSAELLKALGLDEDADEAKALEAAEELADKAKTPAKPEVPKGKVQLDQVELADLKRKADAGEQASKDLSEMRFDTAFTAALDAGRVDAKPETKERFRKFYDADAETTIEALEELPKIVSTEARGSGANDDPGEAPDGIDQESFELDKKVRAHMAEHKEEDYDKALDAVLSAQRQAA